MKMPKKRLALTSSTDSEMSDDNNSSDSIVTSFESLRAYKQRLLNKKKNTNKKESSRRNETENSKAHKSPRGAIPSTSTPSRRGRPNKRSFQQYSTTQTDKRQSGHRHSKKHSNEPASHIERSEIDVTKSSRKKSKGNEERPDSLKVYSYSRDNDDGRDTETKRSQNRRYLPADSERTQMRPGPSRPSKGNEKRPGSSKGYSYSKPIIDDDESDTETERSQSGRHSTAVSERTQIRPGPSRPSKGNEKRPGFSKGYSYSRHIRDNYDDESDTETERSQSGRHPTADSERTQMRPSPSRPNNVLPNVPVGTARRKRGKPRRYRVIDEINKCQRETKLLLTKLPFARVVGEITEARAAGMRWQVLALEALQEAAEIYLVHLFEDAILCTIHRSRLTLSVPDMRLARRIRSRFEDF